MHCVLCGHNVVSVFAASSSVLLNGCVVEILIQKDQGNGKTKTNFTQLLLNFSTKTMMIKFSNFH